MDIYSHRKWVAKITAVKQGSGVLEQPDQATTQTDDNKHSVKRSEDGGSLESQTAELTIRSMDRKLI